MAVQLEVRLPHWRASLDAVLPIRKARKWFREINPEQFPFSFIALADGCYIFTEKSI
ncbi:MAG TPA: hypothetical protein VNN22_14975 [Verrucomicrobiae bacterium]|nr:hypothetical protein [Verrucomicrobiae bacterium]